MDYKRNMFPFVLLGLATALIGFGVYNLNRMPPSAYPDIHGEFSLHSADGLVTSRDMLGKVGLIYFGYTHCPDVCPDTLLRIGSALKLLDADEIAKVAPIFITTDPDRDSPELMAKYSRHFNSHILGLSGSPKEIEAAAKSFLSGYKKETTDKKGNYTVSHASFIIIVRPDGKLDKLMSHTSKPQDIADTIRHLLRWAG